MGWHSSSAYRILGCDSYIGEATDVKFNYGLCERRLHGPGLGKLCVRFERAACRERDVVIERVVPLQATLDLKAQCQPSRRHALLLFPDVRLEDHLAIGWRPYHDLDPTRCPQCQSARFILVPRLGQMGALDAS